MTQKRLDRRTYVGLIGATGTVALAGCLSSDDDEEDEPNEPETLVDTENTLAWGGQGSELATLDCEDDEVGFWKWILTPGGPTEIELEGALLTVEFEDGSEETAEGFRPGEGGGAVQFEIFKDGGGTVEDAEVQFNGGGDNTILTISEAECQEGEDVDPEKEVETKVATDINGSTATLNGELLSIGTFEEVEVFFEFHAVDDDDFSSTDRQTLTEPGTFSAEIDGLEAGVTYEFFAVAEANDHRVTGGVLDFTKDEEPENGEEENDKEEEDETKEDEKDKKKDPSDLKDDLDVTIESTKKDDKKIEVKGTIYNSSPHDYKFSWKLSKSNDGGKIAIDGESKTEFTVTAKTDKDTISIYYDGDKLYSAEVSADY